MDGGGGAARWGSTLGDGLGAPKRKFSDSTGFAWVADGIGTEPANQRRARKPRAAAGRPGRSDPSPPGPAAQPGTRDIGMSSAGNGRGPDAINKLVLDGMQRPSLVPAGCVLFDSFDWMGSNRIKQRLAVCAPEQAVRPGGDVAALAEG